MQSALSSYLQVCFSMTHDVVMSIPLMYEKPESGESDRWRDVVHSSDMLSIQTSCYASLGMQGRIV